MFRRKFNKIIFWFGLIPIFQVFIMPLIIPQWLGNNRIFVCVNILIFLFFLYMANKAGELLNNPTKEDIRDEKIDDILK